MRILHIQKVAGIAGSENHLLTLLPALRDYGYEPTMLALADPADRPDLFIERMQAAGIATSLMRIRGDLDLLLLPRLVRFIRRGKYSIVHTHLLHADLYGRFAARLARTKVISTYHCDDPFHLIRGVRQADRISALLCSRIICISKAVKAFVHEQMDVPLSRLNVVYYGLEAPVSSYPPTGLRKTLGIKVTDPLVGIVGRLIEQKGHIYMLEAMRLILDSIPAVHLVFVGDGELRRHLEAVSTTLGIKPHVHFLGYRTDVSSLMSEFDIVAVPSLFEGFGLVLLEGMAACKPIVASRVSAIPEILANGEAGLLVPPSDAKALAEAVLRLIKDPGLALSLGQRGARRLEQQFSVRKMIEDTARIYQSILQPANFYGCAAYQENDRG
jgi:glycosyltransferase involved in cell wall biosynthesis